MRKKSFKSFEHSKSIILREEFCEKCMIIMRRTSKATCFHRDDERREKEFSIIHYDFCLLRASPPFASTTITAFRSWSFWDITETKPGCEWEKKAGSMEYDVTWIICVIKNFARDTNLPISNVKFLFIISTNTTTDSDSLFGKLSSQ